MSTKQTEAHNEAQHTVLTNFWTLLNDLPEAEQVLEDILDDPDVDRASHSAVSGICHNLTPKPITRPAESTDVSSGAGKKDRTPASTQRRFLNTGVKPGRLPPVVRGNCQRGWFGLVPV